MPHRRWLLLFRIAVVAAVSLALILTLRDSLEQIRESEIWRSGIHFPKLLLAVLAYTGSMILSAYFWRLVLISLGHRPGWIRCLHAFFVSQFGKYVPGKAMVVIIRSDMIRDDQLSATQAAASVVIETLTWIFVGSVLASFLAFWQFRGHSYWAWVAISLAFLTGFVTFPPVVNFFVSRFVRQPQRYFFSGLTTKTLIIGWILMTMGWSLNGLSLWLVIASIPGSEPVASDFWLALTSVALATVLGFVSMIPGGLGVREMTIIPLLAPRFGSPVALFAAVMIRLVWLSALIFGSVIIYGIHKSLKHRENKADDCPEFRS